MKKYIYFCLLVLLLGVTGCKKAPDFGDAVYMTGTLQSSNIRFLVDGQSSMGLTVTSTNKTGADVRIGLKRLLNCLPISMRLLVEIVSYHRKVVILLRVRKW